MKSLFKTSAHVALCLSATIGGMLFISPVKSAHAQDMDQRMRELESRLRNVPFGNRDNLPQIVTFRDDKRAVIGITLGSSGRSDTLGLLVDEVTKGGPADKAGIHDGARITEINGVNLRIASADAADPEMQGISQRRMQREMAKAKPGDDVELRVVEGGKSQTVKVKTVSAADMNSDLRPAGIARTREPMEKRASLGVSIGVSGSVRDTLGLFISSVTNNGPAEKAGVVEGDRIAGINGVDVRVPKEDADDAQASSARVNRFMRELAKAAPGDKINLRVYSGGRYREVPVTAGNSAEVGGNSFRFNFGDGPMMMNLPRVNGSTITIPRINGGAAVRAAPSRTVIRRVSISV